MERNVYLEGELGEKFGAHCFVEAPTVSDALKLLDFVSGSTIMRGALVACSKLECFAH